MSKTPEDLTTEKLLQTPIPTTEVLSLAARTANNKQLLERSSADDLTARLLQTPIPTGKVEKSALLDVTKKLVKDLGQEPLVDVLVSNHGLVSTNVAPHGLLDSELRICVWETGAIVVTKDRDTRAYRLLESTSHRYMIRLHHSNGVIGDGDGIDPSLLRTIQGLIRSSMRPGESLDVSKGLVRLENLLSAQDAPTVEFMFEFNVDLDKVGRASK